MFLAQPAFIIGLRDSEVCNKMVSSFCRDASIHSPPFLGLVLKSRWLFLCCCETGRAITSNWNWSRARIKSFIKWYGHWSCQQCHNQPTPTHYTGGEGVVLHLSRHKTWLYKCKKSGSSNEQQQFLCLKRKKGLVFGGVLSLFRMQYFLTFMEKSEMTESWNISAYWSL